MTAGELIRTARQRHGLSQARLAIRAGTSQAAISRIERGEQSPSIKTLETLLMVMGEELELSSRRMEVRYDPSSLRADLRRDVTERMELALNWNRFAGRVAAAGRDLRARGRAS